MGLQAGSRLGHFEILSPLGAGGMGEVYRARDTHLDRQVAIKVLPDRLAGNAESRERFDREAKSIAALSHPNILTIHDFGEQDDVYYAVTELLEGETLRDRMKRKGPMDWREALEIAIRISDGLSAAHKKHIVHRDIKPENLFLTGDGVVKILDFGLARSDLGPEINPAEIGQTVPLLTTPGAVLGTIGYMSPEQARGQKAEPASDVFSLGCVLYEVLTGKRVFERDNPTDTLSAIIRDDPPSLMDTDPNLPARLDEIVKVALEKDADSRYPSGAELREELLDFQKSLSASDLQAAPMSLARPRVLIPAAVVIALLAFAAIWPYTRGNKEQWAREEALPRISELNDAQDYQAAFALAKEAEQHIPTDPVLAEVWDKISNTYSFHTVPAGADVSYRVYSDVDGAWKSLGQTPLDDVRIPLGPYRWKFEKEGFETIALASRIADPAWAAGAASMNLPSPSDADTLIEITLEKEGTLPAGMIPVEGGRYSMPLVGFNPIQLVRLDRYLIDRTEVTNARFKEFVAAGAYQNPRYWKQPFERDGESVEWKEAVAEFKDSTGRPGPATWEAGDYPPGEADYPVSGVTWYEAAAYAEFSGKSLPTIFHWVRAALPSFEVAEPMSPEIIPLSNIGGKGLAEVASYQGMSVSGAYDMAGNVREWCWNAAGNRRYSMGGGWSDPGYMFTMTYPQSPWDRTETNGFRCVKYLSGGELPASLTRAVNFGSTDFRAVESLSPEVMAVYREQSEYDPKALNSKVDAVDETSLESTRETVSYDAAYADERIIARIDLPRDAEPPFQAVIYLSGINSIQQRSYSEMPIDRRLNFVVKGGRAMVRPVLSGMYERNNGATLLLMTGPRSRRELFARWRMDISRTLEYLATRPDIDATKISFMGLSLGATCAPILLIDEPRIKSAILLSGGFTAMLLDEAGVRELVTHVRGIDIPILMINGKYDYIFPMETSQKPMFELFGTPEEDKRHVQFEAGHADLPRSGLIKETLDWLDRYHGPVRAMSK